MSWRAIGGNSMARMAALKVGRIGRRPPA